ncbi:DNA polymerase IV [Schaalia sp. ZJ1691]|uniref:DNA polymerase IV n=1 Tax=Schaalia sp. ZJ1691 TaxID=2709404 RepID=UPI0013EB2CCA|nr:DNA polymerase IV [Schaalia sp. ZJ1691]
MSNAPRDRRTRTHWGDDDSQTPILHVDMDSFFAQVELLEHPELQGKPLIVGGRGNRGVVTSATYEARALGVRAGMPMAQARALCPNAQIVAGSHHIYGRYSRRVIDVLSQVTPVLEQVSIDEAFLDVSGARKRLGTPVEIGRLVRKRIRDEVGLPASVGIAATKSVAKIASANAKPDGLLLIPEQRTTDFLHGLPVGALWGVGGKTASILDREGVETIGDLARLPMTRLNKLLGAASAYQLHQLAWGIDPRPVSGNRQEKSVGTETTFPRDITRREEIERFILDAAHQCAQRLRAHGYVAWTVAIKVRDASFHTVTRSVTLSAPTDVGRDIADAARMLFDRYTIPSGGIRLCGVRAEGLQLRSRGVAVPLDTNEKILESERAMDRVVERFGKYSIVPASLLVDGRTKDGRTER